MSPNEIDPKIPVSGWPFLQFFVPVFLLDRNNSRLKILRCVSCTFPQLEAMPSHWRWTLQVLSPLNGIFHLEFYSLIAWLFIV